MPLICGRSAKPSSLYTTQSRRDVLPYGEWNGGKTSGAYDGSRANDWTTLLTATLNPKAGSSYNDIKSFSTANPGARGMFLCPSAIQGDAKGILTHYSAHPRLMPDMSYLPNYDTGAPNGNYPSGANGWRFRPYQVSWIKRSADVALIFDGSLMSNSGGTEGQWGANVIAERLDNSRIYYDNFLTDDASRNYPVKASQPWLNATNPIDTSPDGNNPQCWNKDGNGTTSSKYPNWGNIRFRHGKENTANVLYVDGHVQTAVIKDKTNCTLTRGNIDVPYVKSTEGFYW